MYVFSGTVNVYGTAFSSNTASGNGPDINNYSVTEITIYSFCPAGESSNWGEDLQVYGAIIGTLKSTLPCSPCGAGKFQDQIGQEECVDCIAGTFSEIVGSTNSDCNNCTVSKNSE